MACGLHRQFGPGVHFPLWPVLRGRSVREHRATTYRQGHEFVATLAPHHHDTGWSCHTSGSRLHRVERVALVWHRGQIVLVGARWKCGSETCLANLGPPEASPPELRYCGLGCWTEHGGPVPLDLVHANG